MPSPEPADGRRDEQAGGVVLQLPGRRHDSPPGTVTALTLIDQVGITYRQLDYWCRTGLLNPVGSATPGSGINRSFTMSEVHRAAVLQWLLAAGISLQTCRAVIDGLMETGTARLNPTLTVHLPEEY